MRVTTSKFETTSIDKCQCSTSRAIQEPVDWRAGFSKSWGLSERVSFLPSRPHLSFFGSRSITCAAKTENPFLGFSLLRNMTKTLASQLNLACPLPVFRPRLLCINGILSCTEASWNDCDKDLKSANLWSSG